MTPDGEISGRPPPLLERVLRRMMDEAVAESAWGDLEEQAADVARRYGLWISRIWIWLHGARLVLDVLDVRRLWRREAGVDNWSARRRRLAARVGILAALPAALLVVSGLLTILSGSRGIVDALDKSVFAPQGFVFRVVLHPAVVLGGLGVAVALNLLPLLRLRLDRSPDDLRGTMSIRLRGLHLGIGGAGMALLLTILAYGLAENFEIVARQPAPDIAAAVASGAGWTAIRRSGEPWVVRTVGGGLTAESGTEVCGWGPIFRLESLQGAAVESLRLEPMRVVQDTCAGWAPDVN
jgi:hypothetical protein